MQVMNLAPRSLTLRRLIPGLGLAVALAACTSSGGAGWTYAPLGPTPSATTSAEPTGSAGPSGSPALTIQVETPQSNPVAFEPNTLDAPPATLVQVDYNNDSNQPHNIKFFDGPDSSAPVLGATDVVTGPAALESVSITTPATAGDYFFWCDVHGAQMTGILSVGP